LAVLVLTLGACAPQPVSQPAPSPTAGELDKVMAAGAKEGTVTVYNVLGTQLNEALVQGMKKYGITVETIGGTGGELEQRIKTEQNAKAYVADILITGWTNNLNLVTAQMAEPVATSPVLAEKGVWRMNPGQYDPTKAAFVFASAATPSRAALSG